MGFVVMGSTSIAEEIEIGAKAPDFKATGVDGKTYSLERTKGAKAVVLAFTCNKCPVAVAYEDRFIELQKKHGGKEVQFIAINVNTTEDLKAMKERAEEKGLNYPYAYDESGDSARAYGARVTPHIFVIDKDGKVAYRGSFDDDQRDPKKPYVENAIKALLAGEKPEVATTKAFGCGVRPAKK
jgi:peroxiredoxin